MKKLNILVIVYCFTTVLYSNKINESSDFDRIKNSEVITLISSEFIKFSTVKLYNYSEFKAASSEEKRSNSAKIITPYRSFISEDLRPKYRIGFDAPKIDHRQILLTIDENTTDDVDWGYDAEIYQIFDDDMYWLIEGKKYVIQATNTVSNDKEILLGIRTIEGGIISIKIDSLENVSENTRIYLKDNELNEIYDITNNAYETTLPAGEYHSKYSIIFKNINDSSEDSGDLSNDLTDISQVSNIEFLMYVDNINSVVNIKNQQLISVNSIDLYNTMGQKVQSWQVNLKAYNLSFPVNVISGVYLLHANTEKGKVIKRIVMKQR